MSFSKSEEIVEFFPPPYIEAILEPSMLTPRIVTFTYLPFMAPSSIHTHSKLLF